MGNQQSNENIRKRRVVFVDPKMKENTRRFMGKFVRKETYESFIRFYLDNYLVYKDGSYKYIDLANCPIFSDIKDVLEVLDIDYIRNYNHTKTFSNVECWDLFGMTRPTMEWEDSKGNIRDLDGNTISELSDCLGSIGEMLEQKNNMQAYMETSYHANNHAWTKQTSWDMPPGWK